MPLFNKEAKALTPDQDLAVFLQPQSEPRPSRDKRLVSNLDHLLTPIAREAHGNQACLNQQSQNLGGPNPYSKARRCIGRPNESGAAYAHNPRPPDGPAA